jgi:hypothetical protein
MQLHFQILSPVKTARIFICSVKVAIRFGYVRSRCQSTSRGPRPRNSTTCYVSVQNFLEWIPTLLLLLGNCKWGVRWRSWLRQCTTSRKVVVSIPDGVRIFHWHNPSGLTVALGSTVSNGNEYQVYYLEGKCGRCVGLTNLPPSCADCLEIWEPQTSGTLRACPGLSWDCFVF